MHPGDVGVDWLGVLVDMPDHGADGVDLAGFTDVVQDAGGGRFDVHLDFVRGEYTGA